MKPFVKICGLKRVEDARLAARLGATHVGVVRAPSSPRCASLDEARAIFDAASGAVAGVLVFKGVAVGQIVDDARRAGAAGVQLFEFDEADALRVESEGIRVYRVFHLAPDARALPPLVPEPSEERPAMLDVGSGGSGKRFDWRLLGERAPRATFVAGGIDPENVVELLRYRPYGIDLSSGVEFAPGVKDAARLEALFHGIQEASS
jgi:phosphoribosylanthranilate isomerase